MPRWPFLITGSLISLLQVAEAAQLRLKLPEPLGALQGLENGTTPTPNPLEGCFEVGKSMCIEGGDGKVFNLRPPATLLDLEIWYTFDQSLPVDESGHKNHLQDAKGALTSVVAGPGILGRGASASFDGREMRQIPATERMASSSFTVALWLYLLEDSIGGWRTIFSVGSSPDDLLPALLLYPDERRLHARLSKQVDKNNGVLDSSGIIPLRRWTHIALVSTGGVLRLYINGQKDGEAIVGEARSIAEDQGAFLHLGRDPWRAGVKAYMDDFRWYSRVIQPSEIRALTFPSLTGIGVDFVHLGCTSCTYPEAVDRCTSSRRSLCSLQDLFAGGFHTARVMGWLPAVPEVWYYNERGVDLFAGNKKLGLCCASTM